MEKKVSKVESEKENSNFLRGILKEQLAQETPHFDDSVKNVLKFYRMGIEALSGLIRVDKKEKPDERK